MASRVRLANKASASQLVQSVDATIRAANGSSYSLSVMKASELDCGDRERIFSIFEENMHTLYKSSSFGWNPSAKKEELFDQQSIFLLARVADDSETRADELVAYAMFRFERENRQNVVYCYEMQISKNAQRFGLGTILMQQMMRVGRQWGMHQLMLTVFRVNTLALKFYKAMGFDIDPTSPNYCSDEDWEEEDEADYEILSKAIEK